MVESQSDCQDPEFTGTVWFPRGSKPTHDNIVSIVNACMSVDDAPTGCDEGWAIKLVHDVWGSARLADRQGAPELSDEFLAAFAIGDRDLALAPANHDALLLTIENLDGHPLSARKKALRFLRAIMSSTGVLALDHIAHRAWTRAALEDEMSHDADLDIESIFTYHAVTGDDDKAFWLHTHGLGEIGLFDFDILDPACDLLWVRDSPRIRAIAYAVLEGSADHHGAICNIALPEGSVAFTEINRFIQGNDLPTARRLAELIDSDHNERRLVVTEPMKLRSVDRCFRRRPAPSKFMSNLMPSGYMAILSQTASEMEADRARRTYEAFRRFHAEFAEFGFDTGVKIGLECDDGDGRDHVWCDVHSMRADYLEATLISTPHSVSNATPGKRRMYPVEWLSDWVIVTPYGRITARNSDAARMIRENPKEVRRRQSQES